MSKVHALFERFADDFVCPLHLGGEARTHKPLRAAFLEHFSHGTPSDPVRAAALNDALLREMNRIAPVESLFVPDVGLSATWMALHNLFMLTDPKLDRALARGAMPKIAKEVEGLVAAIPQPQSRATVLSRHIAIERALGGQRRDTVVKNWAYTYRFYGRKPPANVTALPAVRFVKQQHSLKGFETLMAGVDEVPVAKLCDALISRSPFSEWVLAGERELTPAFGRAFLCAISDGGVRAGLVRTLVEQGLGPLRKTLGAALRKLSALDPGPQFLFVALLFVAELQLLEVIDERAGTQPPSEPDVGDEELYAAVLPAAYEHVRLGGHLAHRFSLEAADLSRVAERAQFLRHHAGEDAFQFANSLFERAQDFSLAS